MGRRGEGGDRRPDPGEIAVRADTVGAATPLPPRADNWVELLPDADGKTRLTLSLQMPRLVTDNDDGRHIIDITLKVSVRPLPKPTENDDARQPKLPGVE